MSSRRSRGATVRLRLPVDQTHSRPGNTVAGPSLMALADCAAWLVIVAQIGPVALAVTTSLHIDFLRKPALVDVVAVGTLSSWAAGWPSPKWPCSPTGATTWWQGAGDLLDPADR